MSTKPREGGWRRESISSTPATIVWFHCWQTHKSTPTDPRIRQLRFHELKIVLNPVAGEWQSYLSARRSFRPVQTLYTTVVPSSIACLTTGLHVPSEVCNGTDVSNYKQSLMDGEGTIQGLRLCLLTLCNCPFYSHGHKCYKPQLWQ
jgi:hypothetical protein